MFTGGILTASDKGSKGDRQDESGPTIQRCLDGMGIQWVKYAIVPDEKQAIMDTLQEWTDAGLDLIFTTGGTGLSPRDVTPDATVAMADRLVPGISEAIRAEGMKKTPMAMLSRAVAAVRRRTLIINLPGSPRAVTESLEVIRPALLHAIETLRGEAAECARRDQ